MITSKQAREHAAAWDKNDRIPTRCGSVVLELADQQDALIAALLEVIAEHQHFSGDLTPIVNRARALLSQHERAEVGAITGV